MKIYEKLNQIQTELNVPKEQRNNFGNYNYRSSEDILEGVKPLLEKTKTAITVSDEINLVGDRYYIKATAKLIDIETGESVEAIGFAREEESKKGMDSSQLTGSTSSYARKYALNGLLAIDDNKDADSTNKHEKDEPNGSKPASNSNANNRSTKSEATKDQDQTKKGQLLGDILKVAESRKITTDMLTGIIQEEFKKKNSSEMTMQELYALKKRIEA